VNGNDRVEEDRRLVDEYSLTARAKMPAKKQIRETERRSAAFRARSGQLGFAYARLVIGSLPFDRGVVRAAAAEALLNTTGHPARIRRPRCKRYGRRNGTDQQEERRNKRAQSC
jgi:hypothetical protein